MERTLFKKKDKIIVKFKYAKVRIVGRERILVEQEISKTLEARNKTHEGVKRKRDAEDEQLKNEVFVAFQAMAIPTPDIPDPKRRKTHSTAVPTEQERLSLAHQKRILEESQTFRLKAIQNTDAEGGETWYSSPEEPLKYFRFNEESQSFEPHTQTYSQADKYPGWVLTDGALCTIYFDRSMARIALRVEAGWLRIEFWTPEELDRFISFCESETSWVYCKFSGVGFLFSSQGLWQG